MKRLNKNIFYILIIIQIFGIQCKKEVIENIGYINEKDTSYFIEMYDKMPKERIETAYEYYPFIINDTIAIFYGLNSMDNVVIFIKKKEKDSISRYIFSFDDGGYINCSEKYRFYLYRECRKNPNCLHYFDSLPYYRKNDLSMLNYIKNDTNNVIKFNKIIKLLGKINPDTLSELIFKTQILPTYFGILKPGYTLKEYNELIDKNGIYRIYRIFRPLKDTFSIYWFYYKLKIKSYEKNPWIIEQKKFLSKYMELEKENLKKSNYLYIYTQPDLKLFKFEIDTNTGMILKKEYIGWYYKWLHPFMFFQSLCRPQSDDEYSSKKYDKFSIWDYRYYDERDYDDN